MGYDLGGDGARMASLDELRQRIDALDDDIVALLNRRAEAAVEIGRLKNAAGSAVFSPDREKAILDRICRKSTGPLSKASLLSIYRELMSASFALERPPRVGFLGPKGSYSHEAAVSKFGASVEYEALVHIGGVFDAMERGHIDYGVVPVENNTTGGVVLDTLDAFVDTGVMICNELQLPIHLNLMANCPMDEIEVVQSKPEAFKQVQRWLAETGMVDKVAPAASTSRAAELAATTKGTAAIGSALAAKLYGVQILAANIEDNPRNATRFFVLGREAAKPTGNDRTSLMFVTAHRAGALVEALLAVQKNGVNLSMITSRPSAASTGEYNFFVDLDGHATDGPVQATIEEMRQHCKTVRLLGSYPKPAEAVAA
ncbi:MAG: prephenate dehydratase [Phycisphaerales bacterium]|nr:prephenate dehydratase [Phycisphaerales bacterium]